MIIAELIIAGLVVWFSVLSAKWCRDGHEGTMSKILRLEVRLARDRGKCMLCGSTTAPSLDSIYPKKRKGK